MRYIFFAAILLCGICCFGQGHKTGTYLWNHNSLSGNLSSKTQIVFSEKLHYNVDQGQFNYYQTDIIFYRQVHKKFKLGVALRNAHAGRNENRVSEVTPQLYGVYQGAVKKAGINFSNRLDFRNFDNGTHYVRYRNKFSLASPVAYTKLNIRPYLAEEMFVKLNGEGFYNFRLFGGLYLFDIRFLKVNLFYCRNMIQSDDSWKYQNVTALYLYFKI
jgi:hypothetical protein